MLNMNEINRFNDCHMAIIYTGREPIYLEENLEGHYQTSKFCMGCQCDRDSKYPATCYAAEFIQVPSEEEAQIFMYEGKTYLEEVMDDFVVMSISAHPSSFKMDVRNGTGEAPGHRFGHSSTYVPMLNSIAVFGGLEYERFTFATLPKDSSLYLFNIETEHRTKVWLNISVRAFHSTIVSGEHLIILGGVDATALESHYGSIIRISLRTYNVSEVSTPFTVRKCLMIPFDKDVLLLLTTKEAIVFNIQAQTCNRNPHQFAGRSLFRGR